MSGLNVRVFGLVVAFLLLNLTSAAVAAPNYHQLQRRIAGEHVILADCRDGNGVVSSQMAYFNSTPGPKPNDVSIVHTNPGEAALWINRVTEGLFTDTGVTFVATLGPKVADGTFAGTGQNGYANFTCWQRYIKELYKYGGTTCSQVYDCNHDKAPGEFSPGPNVLLVPTFRLAVLPTPVGGNDTSSDPMLSPSGVSQGAVVGIVVGIVGAVLLAASVGLFYWYWRRTHRNEQPPAPLKWGGLCCGLFGRKEFIQPLPGSPDQPFKDATAASYPGDEAKGTPIAYEMDGNWHRVEMGAGHGRVEIDTEHKAEIDSRPVVQQNTEPQEIDSVSPLTDGTQSPTIPQVVGFVQQASTLQK